MKIHNEKPRKKKPNKQQRDARKAHDAEIFNQGFVMGYEMGKQQGIIDANNAAVRNVKKFAHYGR